MYSRKVHDLVGRAFNDFSGPGTEWRHHPDKDPANNRADNLIWGSHFENSWDWIVDSGRKEDWGIYKSGNRKNPWMLMMHLTQGEGQKYVGCFLTIEAARAERDRLCLLYDMAYRVAA
jgi:hypothetical protein